jgi:hypothetical protein
MSVAVRQHRWNSILMAARFEAFAVAGCDVSGMLISLLPSVSDIIQIDSYVRECQGPGKNVEE